MHKSPKARVEISLKTIIRFWLVPLTIVAIVAAVYWASPALIMIFVAFFLAIVLNRPTAFLEKHIKSRAASASIAMIALILIIVLAFSTVIPLFVKQTVSFVSSLPDTFSQLQNSGDTIYELIKNNHLEEQYAQVVDGVKDSILGVVGGAAQNVVGLFGGLLNSILAFVLVLIMAFFMLVEGPVWMERYWRLVYRNDSRREYHQKIAEKMYGVISGYVNGTAVVGLVSAVLGGLGLCITTLITPAVPVDVIIPSMLVMFICAFIPMFGAGIAGVVICLLLLLYSWPAALIFAIYFTIYQQIENNIFMPKIFAKHIKISPLTVLLAVVVGTYCGGFLGIFISIPVAGCLQILVREFIVKKKLSGKAKVDTDSKKIKETSEPKATGD
jgi:predicted PurR-regulated permease PerM